VLDTQQRCMGKKAVIPDLSDFISENALDYSIRDT
jgi:hypothetical protein